MNRLEHIATTATVWLAALLASTLGALAVTLAVGDVVPTALIMAVWCVLAFVGVAALAIVAIAVWVGRADIPADDEAPLSRLDELDGHFMNTHRQVRIDLPATDQDRRTS